MSLQEDIDRCEFIISHLKALKKLTVEDAYCYNMVQEMLNQYELEQERLDDIWFNSPEYKELHPLEAV